MPKDNATLYRPYGPGDLDQSRETSKIAGTIVVQAAPSNDETEYLLELADKTESIKGVVGWIDFEDPKQLKILETWAKHPKFKGVRPMIQDIEDPDWMLRSDISWGFEAITDLDLTFDALGLPKHLSNLLKLLKRHPDMKTVLDHGMKPEIRNAQKGEDALSDWADGMTRIAQETKAFCKLSGLVTEASNGWTLEDLKPFTDHILDVFGAKRTMWGSDWPVCRLACEYEDWVKISSDLTQDLSEEERTDLFGRTASRFYNIT